MCDFCNNLPEFINDSLVSELDHRQTEQSWTVEGFASGAAEGCRLCVLIWNGFQNSGRQFPKFKYWFEARDEKYDGVIPFGHLCVWTITLQGREVCHFEVQKSWDAGIQIPIEHDIDSSIVRRRAQEWLTSCVDTHDCGRGDMWNAWIPTRLIDLGRKGDPQRVRLATREDVKDADRRYTALSHCWGPDAAAVPRTVLDTLDARRQGIEVNSLTKTFQDFLELTRELGIRYAWIDSLCIIQDSQADFEVECAQMCDVYSQAYCTIAASDATDRRGGCFMPREPSDIEAVQLFFVDPETVEQNLNAESFAPSHMVKIYPVLPPFTKAISGSLSKRGWTLQERELSPRILHFTQNRLLWECRRTIATEEFPTLANKSEVSVRGSDPANPLVRLVDENDNNSRTEPKEVLYRRWQTLVEEYSRRLLTNKANRLAAISGLAAKFARLIQSSAYLAGIWEDNLFHSLCWIPYSPSRSLTQEWPPQPIYPGTPSWSWAAFDGPIMHFGDDCNRYPATLTVGTGDEAPFTRKAGIDLFGSVSGGAITLSGRAMEVVVSESDHHPAFNKYRPSSIVMESPNEILFAGQPSQRQPDIRAAAGVQIFVGPSKNNAALDFRTKKFRNSAAQPPKMYTLEGNTLTPVRMCILFDIDPAELPPTKLLCLETNWGKCPWPLSGIPSWNGLVLLKTGASEPCEYRRVGLFLVERKDPAWLEKNNPTKATIV